ncbi:MAG: EVE domain-containing protein [Pyrinomonadaceae bacterium]|nr:EVE domain-containing protein [Pyrinomonadaceae bacterium]MCX7640590.1 EVE domain-containing protein [Pyrinomonadaceae bacterium]MDW8303829.1 EVE domain-containing protein [Acidobacteriota bacterium]
MRYWLVKQEPTEYSFDQLLEEGETDWTGVRNYQARNNLRQMKKGDKVLFYHSGAEKAVVGLAEVSKEHFPDPTDSEWTAVKIKPIRKLKKPVTLQQIKGESTLENIALVRQPRLSVMPLAEAEFEKIIQMSS